MSFNHLVPGQTAQRAVRSEAVVIILERLDLSLAGKKHNLNHHRISMDARFCATRIACLVLSLYFLAMARNTLAQDLVTGAFERWLQTARRASLYPQP